MSTKSDFAQKLLNDLRMRKERMAAASQSSSAHSTQLTITTSDAYGNPKQANHGSRQIKTLESAGIKPTKQHKRSNMTIVPFKGGQQNQNSPKLGDLSMVFTFALENGIKLIGLNGSTNNQVLPRSVTHQLPTLSTTHINDISKGAHKLNEILRAYSNGVSLDRQSVEIGNRLLKGAMDLEESLRMLVNLQEASEYMSTPNRKNHIRLLDEEEEEEEDGEVDNNELANKQKQLVIPRFSFDKPRKNDQKGRISSVIAKLMGLDDMSNNVRTNNMRKDSSSEQKVTAVGSKNSDSGNRNNHSITHLAIGKPVIQNSRANPNTQNGFQEKRKLERETVVKSEEKKVPKERTGSSSSKNRTTLHSKQRDLQKESETELRNSSRSKDEIVGPEKKHHLPSDKETADEQPQKLQTNSRKSEEVVIMRPNVQKRKVSSGSIKEKSLNVVPIERKNGSLPHFATPLRHQVPISNDVKEKKNEKKNNFKRAEKGSSLKLREANKELHKEAAAAAAECENMILDAPEELSTNLTDRQPNQTSLSSDQLLTPQKKKEQDDSHNNGNSEERTTVSPPSNQDRKEISASRKPLVLTEDEAHLKLILIKSQLFIHTAVALFKLDFPVGILHISDYSNSQAKDDKVIIDCGYEITRRKGRRQDELVHYPSLKLSSVRIESLDELVRRLNEELGNLKSYGRSKGESADNLFNMLEKDIAVNKNPDINCMWDLGWNHAMFALAEREETIRDVEKQVLNGLLYEVTRDLLSPLNAATF